VSEDLIKKGLQAHRAGRLEDAKTFYEQALASNPRHPDALHLSGVVALQTGHAELAVTRIEQALAQQPKDPGFLGNLAQACLAARRPAEAEAAFRRAAALEPHSPQFLVGAASCLGLMGRLSEAEQELREILKRHPRFTLAWLNLGRAVSEQGRLQEAAELYSRVLELEPGSEDACMALGSALRALERHADAEKLYRRFIAAQPASVAGHCNLAFVLIDQGAFAEAVDVCRRALAFAPRVPELHTITGTALAHGGRLAHAVVAFRTALEIEPHNLRAHWGYGYALVETGHAREGIRWLEGVLDRQPDAPEFRDSLSAIRLSLGDLQAGWADYPWRAARRKFLSEHPGSRLADGLPASAPAPTVALLREQGLGDELFFLRFAPRLKAKNARIEYQAHPKLASLLARVPALDRVVASGEATPKADAVFLVGDLPRALDRFAASPLPPRAAPPRDREPGTATAYPLARRIFFPVPPPPLDLPVLPAQLERMQARLSALGPPPYFGVTWRAGTPPSEQRGTAWVLHKEVGLESLGPVLRGAGGTWVSLQRNPAPGETERLATHAGAPVHDLSALNEDLEAMVAVLALLDDYVGVSNTNMHLRAGVGKTARVLVPSPAEWRWMNSGESSPWFPGFRIYRQAPDGSWSAALARLARDLGPRG
jgi:tetratricopeptide (TPR) repeat protein